MYNKLLTLSLSLLPSYTCNNNGGDNGNLKTLRNMLINRVIFKELCLFSVGVRISGKKLC